MQKPPPEVALPRAVEAIPDDAQLIKQLQRGDTSAFDLLVGRYEKRIYQLVRRYVSNSEDARDMTQEVFLKAFEACHRFRKDAQFYTWLYRIAKNLCIDRLRKRDASCSLIYDSESNAFCIADLPAGRSASPTVVTENRELLEHIHQAVQLLSPQQREVFILRFWEGFSLKEIAEHLNRSLGTVKAHLFHGSRKVRAHLIPYLESHPLPDDNQRNAE